jgi:hypothetical protein
VDGKVDWMAYGLPVEGERGPYVGSALVDVETCVPDEPAAEAAARLHGRAAVVTETGVVIGAVDPGSLRDAPDGATVADVMDVVPDTLRPSVPLAEIDDRVAGRFVTTSAGVLLGAVDQAAVTQESVT